MSVTPEEIDAQLRGTTYRVLVYLLNHKGPMGVRELQRDLGMASPGQTSYHLEKLMRLGLVAKDKNGDYVALREVKADLLGATVKIRRLRLPRYLFYSVFYTTIFGACLTFFFDSPLERFFLLTLAVTGLVFLWYEVWKLIG